MCGLVGMLVEAGTDVEDRLTSMTASLRHRGPDDEGRYESVCHTQQGTRWLFGFRRLAVIDLTADGHQPIVDQSTGNVLVYNGEIYNFRELRNELESDGYRFRSRCDSEVVLLGYSKWGATVVDHLRGMFAFAIYDSATGHVILARDRIGEKPLYYCEHPVPGGIRFAFASEVRTLLAGGMTSRSIAPSALHSYMANGFVLGTQTLIRGVRLLDAGCLLEIDDQGHVRKHRYWELPLPDQQVATDDPWPDRVGTCLTDLVKRQMISDAPLGAFLSGGIDSSIVVGLAQRHSNQPLRTFTLSFEESDYDEAQYARTAAREFGTDHQEEMLTRSDFRNSLCGIIGALDQPSFDGANIYFIARAARHVGLTVAIAGTGGDELFGGYTSFSQLPKIKRALRWMGLLPLSVRASLRRTALSTDGWFRGGYPSQTAVGKSMSLLDGHLNLVHVYQTLYRLFLPETVNALVNGSTDACSADGLDRETEAYLTNRVDGRFDLSALSWLELRNYLGNRLLRDTDSVSMAVSLEVRLPLVDYELIEHVSSVPESERFYPIGRKRCLIESGGLTLPTSILHRKKRGFVLPIDVWLRDAVRAEASQILLDSALCRRTGLRPESVARLWTQYLRGNRGLYWTRIWAIFVLLRWCDMHRVSIAV